MSDLVVLERMAIALAIGILVGLERGWHGRDEPEGSRVAGIRSFGLIGLLGAAWALLGDFFGPIVLGLAFLAFAIVLLVARVRAAFVTKDYGATTIIAGLLTFALGALAMQGELAARSPVPS
jgi:hypothetical protein